MGKLLTVEEWAGALMVNDFSLKNSRIWYRSECMSFQQWWVGRVLCKIYDERWYAESPDMVFLKQEQKRNPNLSAHSVWSPLTHLRGTWWHQACEHRRECVGWLAGSLKLNGQTQIHDALVATMGSACTEMAGASPILILCRRSTSMLIHLKPARPGCCSRFILLSAACHEHHLLECK